MELEYWLRLGNARHISPRQCIDLLERFGSPQAICESKANELAACEVKPAAIIELHRPDRALLDSQLRWAALPRQFILSLEDPRYPPLLKAITDPPPILFGRGDPLLLSSVQLAMVGSRRPSPGGLRAATEFATALAEAGITITSGLAVGIDGASHQGALLGGGPTIAVLGSGLARIYPSKHLKLAEEIAAQGVLISEFPPQAPPLAAHFPRRNRIISGLSCGTCVVEAAMRSGSLITARLAVEQGREVFAFPGSIFNPMTGGCHLLIQQGAKLVATLEDILTELKHGSRQWCIIPSKPPALELDSVCRQLLECIGFEEATVDELVERSGRTAGQVVESLLNLELKGCVQVVAGNYYRV